MPQSAGYCHIFQNVTTLMSTIQVTREMATQANKKSGEKISSKKW